MSYLRLFIKPTKSLLNLRPITTVLPQSTHKLLFSFQYSSKKNKSKSKSKFEEKEYKDDIELPKEIVEIDLNIYSDKMEVNLTHLEKELTGLKIGRANPAILDKVQIDTGDEYGIVPLKQLGQVSIKDNQTLTIQLFEDKFLKVVEKSILTSKLNLTPIINNNKINVPIPKLTSETREQLIKQVHLIGENNKLKLRNIRQSGMKQIQTIKKKKNSGISADEIKNLEKELQSILESNNKKVDTLVNDKIKVIKS